MAKWLIVGCFNHKGFHQLQNVCVADEDLVAETSYNPFVIATRVILYKLLGQHTNWQEVTNLGSEYKA